MTHEDHTSGAPTRATEALAGRLRRGLGSQGVGQAVQLFVRIAEVPLLLSRWGTNMYGEWLILAAIPAYLSMTDGGFANTAGREMTIRSGGNDNAGALNVFQSTWALLLILSLCAASATAILVNLVPLTAWFHFTRLDAKSAKAIVVILVLFVVVGFQAGLINGGFWCSGSYPRGMFITAVSRFLEFAGLGTMVVLGGGPVRAAQGYLAGRILGTVLLYLGLRRSTPWLRLGLRHATLAEVRRLALPSLASLAFPLGNAFNGEGLRILIGVVLGPSAVAMFRPIRTFTRFAIQPSTVVERLVQPEMGLAYGGADYRLISRLFLRASQVAVWASIGFSMILALSGPRVLRIWTLGRIPFKGSLVALLLGSVIANAIWHSALMVPYATNRYGRLAVRFAAVYGMGVFLLALLLVPVWGLNGVGAALLVGEVTMVAVVVPRALAISRTPLATWLRAFVRVQLNSDGHQTTARQDIEVEDHAR